MGTPRANRANRDRSTHRTTQARVKTAARRTRARAVVRGSLAITAGLAACAVIAIGLWTPAGAVGDTDDERAWEEIRQLRADGEYAAARGLATAYLAGHPALDDFRQRIHFELGMTYFDEQRHAEAVTELDALVTDYADTDLDAAVETFMVDDAQLHVGHALGEQERPGEAVDAYQAVVDDWPTADQVPTAAQLATEAVMQAELDEWAPHDGQLVESASDYSASVERNLQTLMTYHADSDRVPDTLYAAVEYYRDRAVWNPAAREGMPGKVRELCGWLAEHAPDHRATTQASLIEAEEVLYPADAEAAFETIQGIVERAERDEDAELLHLALFKLGQCQRSMGQPAAARATWAELQEYDLPVELAEQVILESACSLIDDRQFDSAMRAFDGIASDRSVREETRGVALFYKALMQARLGEREAALATFAAVRDQHPGTMSATYASFEIERRQDREHD